MADRKVNALHRVFRKIGRGKCCKGNGFPIWELKCNRKSVGCVHDTADGVLLPAKELGCSDIELKVLFNVGGYKLKRLRDEKNDPNLHTKKIEALSCPSCLQ